MQALGQRLGALQRALERRHAAIPRADERIERSLNSCFEVGRQVAQVAHRRAEVVGGRLEIVDQRPGVGGEALEPGQCGLRLVQEGREDPERLGQGLVARGGGLEGPLGVDHELAKRTAALVDRAEHLAGVAHQALDGEALLVELGQQRRPVDGEAFEVPGTRR